MRFLNFSMEDNADGTSHIEKEYVMYATADKDLIRLATSMQEQEQYEFKQESPKFRQRVRRVRNIYTINDIATTEGGLNTTDEYTLTTKSRMVNVKTSQELETTITASADIFRQFKYASNRGMLKLRCTYPVFGYDELKWEVDFFYDVNDIINGKGDNFYPHVKIDLEVPATTNLPDIPKLPAGFGKPIFSKYHGGSNEEETMIREMYDKYFIFNPNYRSMQ